MDCLTKWLNEELRKELPTAEAAMNDADFCEDSGTKSCIGIRKVTFRAAAPAPDAGGKLQLGFTVTAVGEERIDSYRVTGDLWRVDTVSAELDLGFIPCSELTEAWYDRFDEVVTREFGRRWKVGRLGDFEVEVIRS